MVPSCPDNRDADLDAAKRAWNAAGHEGTISESLFGKIRSKLKLTGKRGANGRSSEGDARPVSKGKAKAKGKKGVGASKVQEPVPQAEARSGDSGPSKSAFVEEVLGRQPEANVAAVNRAWAAAGHEGSISPSVFFKVKRELGGTGGGSTAAPVKAGPKSASEGPDVGPATAEARPELYGETVLPPVSGPEPGGRERVLDRVEDGIDDLIIELKRLGGMEEALEAMRKVRRVVVRSHGG
jgi:hypothetical protein